MKNIFLIIFFLLITFTLNGCNNENQKVIKKEPIETVSELEKVYMEMREIAWTSLSNTDKETVIGDWQDALVIEEQVTVKLSGEKTQQKL